MARENVGHAIGPSHRQNEARNAVAMLGFGDEIRPLPRHGLDEAARVERAGNGDVDARARIELLQALRQPLDGGRRRQIGL